MMVFLGFYGILALDCYPRTTLADIGHRVDPSTEARVSYNQNHSILEVKHGSGDRRK